MDRAIGSRISRGGLRDVVQSLLARVSDQDVRESRVLCLCLRRLLGDRDSRRDAFVSEVEGPTLVCRPSRVDLCLRGVRRVDVWHAFAGAFWVGDGSQLSFSDFRQRACAPNLSERYGGSFVDPCTVDRLRNCSRSLLGVGPMERLGWDCQRG